VALVWRAGESAASLGLTGEEVFDIEGLEDAVDPEASGIRSVQVRARRDGDAVEVEARVRLDTPNEVGYYRNGGILQRVLRGLR